MFSNNFANEWMIQTWIFSFVCSTLHNHCPVRRTGYLTEKSLTAWEVAPLWLLEMNQPIVYIEINASYGRTGIATTILQVPWNQPIKFISHRVVAKKGVEQGIFRSPEDFCYRPHQHHRRVAVVYWWDEGHFEGCMRVQVEFSSMIKSLLYGSNLYHIEFLGMCFREIVVNITFF